MQFKILFFSVLRDIAGCDMLDLEIAGREASVPLADVVEEVFSRHPGLREWQDKILLAVNESYAEPETTVKSGDEIAMMPPVQGG